MVAQSVGGGRNAGVRTAKGVAVDVLVYTVAAVAGLDADAATGTSGRAS